MEKKLYKDMYEQIRLEERRKKEMLNDLKGLEETRAKGRKESIPSYAAIGLLLCFLIVSNATVFAAAHWNVADQLENALELFFQKELNLSEEQKDIYTDYSSTLDNRIELENGIMELEAMLYDEYYVYIPFKVTLDEGAQEKVMQDEIAQNYHFYLKGTPCVLGKITYVNPGKQEDGSYFGNYLLSMDEYGLEQGDVIEIRKGAEPDADEDELISQITVVNQAKSVALDVERIQKQKGVMLKKMVISSLSVHVEGEFEEGDISYRDLSVYLKDGSQVKHASSGAGAGIGEKNGSYGKYFYAQVLFESPVSLDEVQGIRIQNKKEGIDFWIPMEISD